MSDFVSYKRVSLAEMRPYEPTDLLRLGEARVGDMVERDPRNPKDMWIVPAQFFDENFES